MGDNAKYIISLVDKYSDQLKKIDTNTNKFDKRVVALGRTMGVVFAGGAILGGMAKIASYSSRLAGDMEQTEIAFNTFLGSAEKGRAVLENLNEFANKTPYTNAQIIKTGRALLAANVPAEQMTETLGMIGDIAAGANVPITDLGAIYAKAMNKGKLQAEELNQLAERGIPIIDQLSKEFGVTKQEVFKLGEKGKISSDVMVRAFKSMTKEGGKFYKLMEKQSKSAVGLLSTLEGKTELLGVSIGKRLLPAQKELTKSAISLVDKMNEWVKIPLSDELESQRNEYNGLVMQLRDANIKEEDRERILKRLHEINPKTNEIIKQEGDQLKINESNLKAYNDQQINNIMIKREEERIGKIVSKQNELGVKQADARYELSKKLSRFQEFVNKKENVSADQKERFNKILNDEVSIEEKGKRLRIEGLKYAQKTGKLTTGYVRSMTTYRPINALQEDIDALEKQADALRAKKNDFANSFLGGSGGGNNEIVTGKIEGAEDVTAGVTKITAAAPKVFNINIDKLVENFEVSTNNLSESDGEVRDLVTRTLMEALADVQPLVR